MRFTPFVLLLAACGPSPGVPGVAPPKCGDAPIFFDAFGDVVHGSDDGACARIERRDARDPELICKACPYDPIRLTAGDGELFVDVDDPTHLTYTPTHHNWADEMTATQDGVTAKVRVLYRGGEYDDWKIELTFFDNDTPLTEPRLLTPSG